jgi:hypothetical protein
MGNRADVQTGIPGENRRKVISPITSCYEPLAVCVPHSLWQARGAAGVANHVVVVRVARDHRIGRAMGSKPRLIAFVANDHGLD